MKISDRSRPIYVIDIAKKILVHGKNYGRKDATQSNDNKQGRSPSCGVTPNSTQQTTTKEAGVLIKHADVRAGFRGVGGGDQRSANDERAVEGTG